MMEEKKQQFANKEATMTNLLKDSAIRQGFVFGGILGAFHILFNLINNLMNLQGMPFVLLNQSLLISVILCLWIITFLFMDVIAQNTYMIMDFQKSGSATMNQFIIEDALGATIIELIASLVLGVVLGWFGGWIGSWRTPKQVPA